MGDPGLAGEHRLFQVQDAAAKAARSQEEDFIVSDWFVAVLAGVLVLGAGFWWARRRSVAAEPAAERVRNPYHCVAIRRGTKSCAAASRLEGRRYLPGEAPPLPLQNCDYAACSCRYAHFDDRREEQRRRGHALERGLLSAMGDIDRRRNGDRRGVAEFA